MARDVPKYTKKSVLDIWNAYHSVPIREEDRDKTTFITETGTYRYLRAPQGFLASGDGFTHRESIIARDIKNKVTLVDDSLLWDDTVKENFTSVCKFLEVYGNAGLVINGEKFQFAQDTVNFAGMEVTSTGVRPSKKFLDTIAELPTPTNTKEVRAFHGIVNQANYAFCKSDAMQPFRHLLSSSVPFEWTKELSDKFEEAKLAIVDAVKEGVESFTMDRPTILAVDWSKHGVGYMLLQKTCECEGVESHT